ncbi:MAG: hypothetical protein M1825_005851 [Sarcosagium campestre]|nr:MAG: hypothetical protein M1825_005851 [Sarcosagium campestre]
MTDFPVRISPFLDAGPSATSGSLAVLHLKRDLLTPVRLSDKDDDNDGYDEGRVTNTRFGSFPHSTLIGLPWGSQVRASVVDTGSRGRPGKKRKRNHEDVQQDDKPQTPKAPATASTGFIHILPPTPESWTASLPHRTQVVYTPDYSYILHRLGVRPGTRIIEAGAGSGSFTHAAARAVFNGIGEQSHLESRKKVHKSRRSRLGQVCSYEFHEQRVKSLRDEISEHGLDGVVKITHRDVCQDGFIVHDPERMTEDDGPDADAIFLDLPAPWLALRHLTRSPVAERVLDAIGKVPKVSAMTPSSTSTPKEDLLDMREIDDSEAPSDTVKFRTALNSRTTVRICTFSPCIEQVQRTVATLRHLGWLDIEVVELLHKRLEVRRERVGLHEARSRGVHTSAATVDEALGKLRVVERRIADFHGNASAATDKASCESPSLGRKQLSNGNSIERKLFKEGRIVHRAEPDLKSHTSYLVFALLPREWTAEDESRAQRKVAALSVVPIKAPQGSKPPVGETETADAIHNDGIE